MTPRHKTFCFFLLFQLLHALQLVASPPQNLDSTAAEALVYKGIAFKYSHPDSAQMYYDSAWQRLLADSARLSGRKFKTEKAFILKSEGILHSIKSNFSLAQQKLDESLTVLESIGDTSGMASVLSNMGVVQYFQGNFSIALDLFKQSSTMYQKLGDTTSYIENLSRVAVIYHYISTYDSAIYYNKLVVNSKFHSKNKEDLDYLATAYNNLGISYQAMGNYDTAMMYYTKTISIYEKLGDKRPIGTILSNIGDVLLMKGENSSALDYYLKALPLIENYEERHEKAKNYISIGKTCVKLKQNERAAQFLQMARDSIAGLENDYLEGQLSVALGDFSVQKKQFALAEKHYQKAIHSFESIGARSDQIEAYCQLAELQMNQSQFSEAIQNLEQAQRLVKSNELASKAHIDHLKYLAYKGRSDYQKAMLALEAYHNQSDSLNNLEKEKVVHELEIKFRTAEKENKLLEQQVKLAEFASQTALHQKLLSKNKQQKLQLMLVIALLLIILSLGILLITQQKKKALLRAEARVVQYRLALSKKQLEPHFILNAINSIGYLFQTDNKEEAQYYLGKIAGLINQSLMQIDRNLLPLIEEISFIEKYLCIQQRLLDDLHFSIDLSEQAKAKNPEIPFSLLFAFVENAIKHGLRAKEGQKSILIKGTQNGSKTSIQITDNGIGRKRSKEIGTTDTGKGMVIVQALIDLYNQQPNCHVTYKIHDLLGADNTALGTEVIVEIDFDEKM